MSENQGSSKHKSILSQPSRATKADRIQVGSWLCLHTPVPAEPPHSEVNQLRGA